MPSSIASHPAEQLENAIADLTALLGSRATTAEIHREHHSHGESHHASALPDVVCYPKSTEEVSEVMKISAQYKLPVIPFGAGTSVEGQVNAIHGGITIDLREMNKVLRFSVEDLDATVEAGVTRLQVGKALKDTGLTFFIDPGADATIGGMTATRASGTTAVRYGTMSENVLGLTVVLADGQIIKTGSRARKSSAGYDMTHLFIGSEGTLGVITEVILRLHTLPESVSAAVCAFPTVDAAVRTAMEVIQLGVSVARIEFLDAPMMEATNKYSKLNLPVMPTLFFEFHGMNQRDVTDQAEVVQSIAEEHGGLGFQWKQKADEREALWKSRHDSYYASQMLRPGSKIWTTDACVPISRLAECIVETRKDLDEVSFPATIVGHVGDGNYHVLCVLNPDDPAEMEEAEAFSEKLVKRAQEVGGTCTGEHGVGQGKLKYLDGEHGAALGPMRAIKAALDPENRMNPGKMILPA